MPGASDVIGEAGSFRPRLPCLSLARFRTGLAKEERGLKRSHFEHWMLAYGLLAPQLFILLLFFFIPSVRALIQAFQLADPFGIGVQWVGASNFTRLFQSRNYWASVNATVWFTLALNAVTLAVALLLAFATNHVIRGQSAYRTIILIPYTVAPAISGIIWAFLFNTQAGPVAQALHWLGISWDPVRYAGHAMTLVIMAAAWKHICYNYIFLVAALLAVPKSILESAAIDGAGPIRRFFLIALPVLSPTLFFLVVVNFVYGLFETFAIVDATTRGGPAGATSILVYKVYLDGFVTLDLGSSAAQSVILMAVALALTFAQFRFLERRVNYAV